MDDVDVECPCKLNYNAIIRESGILASCRVYLRLPCPS